MADELYDRFLNHEWKHSFSTHPPAHEAELECVIVEPRCHPRLGGAMRNMSAMLPYAAMTVVCSRDNEDFVKRIVATSPDNNVRIIPHFEGNITRDAYSDFLKTEYFWGELLLADRVLIFQTDSGIRKNDILRFMHFDYVGAPWPWNPEMPVGNGGFSLRNRRLMSEICRVCKKIEVEEDLFFAYCLKQFAKGAVLPCYDEAAAFAVEYGVHDDPMGFHQAHGIHYERDPEYVRRLLAVEPAGAVERLPYIRDAWYESDDGSRITHPRFPGYLRLGISHYGHMPDGSPLLPPPSFMAASTSRLVIVYDA